MSLILGLDVGGTGIKAAIVDATKGVLVTERIKYKTPPNVTPDSLAPVLTQLIKDLKFDGEKIGVGFPSIIRNKICCSANNISDSWIGVDLFEYFEKISGLKSAVINDADAAGLAELHFGSAKNVNGTSILLTLGTGIGSAIYKDGNLLHNTELGSLKFKGDLAEKFVSNKIRKEQKLDWEQWCDLLNEYLQHLNFIFSPQLIILGGGVSKKFDQYKTFLDPSLNIVPAKMFNNAGIVGAAMAHKK